MKPLWLAFASCLLGMICTSSFAAEPVKTDLHGDPLPPGAIARLVGHQDQVTAVAFASQGKSLATLSKDGTARLWEATTGREVCRLPATVPDYIESSLVVSPDGKVIAILLPNKKEILLSEATTGKLLHRLTDTDLSAGAAAFSPDGQLLVSPSWYGLYIWEVATGKYVGQLGPSERRFEAVAFTPDGRRVVTVHLQHQNGLHPIAVVQIRDVATGEEVQRFGGGKASRVALSPDGRLLATAQDERSVIHLWDVSSGRERMRLPTERSWSLTLSPDGRLLAVHGPYNSVELWELASLTVRHSLAGHTRPVQCLAFSPDGKKLASGSDDTTGLVWDLARPGKAARSPSPRPEGKDLEQCWDELKLGDASKARAAIWTMVAGPDEAVPFLRKNVLPVAPPDPQHVARLIADLDNDQFEVRQKATEELQGLAEIAEPALKKALVNQPSLEVYRRIEWLLGLFNWPVRSPEKLRALRAIEALEHIATAEAQDLLKGLAQGAPEALVTQEAKAAVERLQARKVAR